MKRLLILFLTMLVAFSLSGCFTDDDDDDAPAPTTGTIVVNATYTGALEYASAPGTKVIYVYVYSSLANTDTSRAANVKTAQTSTAVDNTGATTYTLTLSDLAPGNYKVVAFYDYSGATNLDNQRDRFIIYNNKTTPDSADVVNVEAGSTDTLTMNIVDANVLLSQSYFVAQP